MEFQCPDDELGCGSTIDHVIFDGYGFGDRMMEGVNFIAEFDDDGELSVRIHPEHATYFEQFNQKMWLERAKEYAEELDIGQCPKCGGDVSGPAYWHDLIKFREEHGREPETHEEWQTIHGVTSVADIEVTPIADLLDGS